MKSRELLREHSTISWACIKNQVKTGFLIKIDELKAVSISNIVMVKIENEKIDRNTGVNTIIYNGYLFRDSDTGAWYEGKFFIILW